MTGDGDIVVRASSLPSYADCQRRMAVGTLGRLFEAHGYLIRPDRTGYGALVGSGVHAGAEHMLTNKLQTGELPPVADAQEQAIIALHDRIAEETDEDRPPVEDGTTKSVGEAEQQVRRMVEVYRWDVADRVTPLVVESRIEVEAGQGLILSGQSDLLHLSSFGGQRVVRDLKTGSQLTGMWKHSAQVGAYSLLFRSQGHETDAAGIDGIQRVSPRKPQPGAEWHPLNLEAGEQLAVQTIRDFGAKARAFRQDGDAERFLANPGSNLCSEKYCRAFGTKACPITMGES